MKQGETCGDEEGEATIRSFLNVDRRELPRVLHQGLSTKKLRSKGQKRAMTYFAR